MTPSGFPVKPKTRTYSAAWKADCLAFVQAEVAKGRAVYDISISLQLHRSTVSVWFREAGIVPPRVPDTDAMARARRVSAAKQSAIRSAPPNRSCLSCGCRFRSEGFHNRLCLNCRQRSTSPYEPNPGGHTGTRVGAKR